MVANVLLTTLRQVWQTLDTSGARLAVMGGLALASWKHVRATRDVDLLVEVPADHVDRLLAVLRAADIEPRRRPAVTNLGKLRIIQCIYEPPGALMDLNVDLLLAECFYQRQALDRRVPEQLAGLNLFILACEDLILHKLLAGRMIDRADCVALLRLQRAELDWAYLKDWAARLEVSEGLAETWAEAFPDEPEP